MRGVPRERRAISRAPSAATSRSSSRAARRHDLLELVDGVEIEPHRDAEAVAQRRRQQPLPRRRADQGEARQVDPHRCAPTAPRRSSDRARGPPSPDRASPRPRAASRWISSMNSTSPSSRLVSSAARSPDLAITGPGGGAEPHAHLARDDLRERRLAEPRRPEEQHMVERLAARLARPAMNTRRFSRAAFCPTNSSSVLGRSAASTSSGLRAGGEEAVVVGHHVMLDPVADDLDPGVLALFVDRVDRAARSRVRQTRRSPPRRARACAMLR